MSMTVPHDPRLNHLLRALPGMEYARLLPHLELVPMPLGGVLYESGSRLRYVRSQHGLSQRQLARRTGVTNSTISLIESNRSNPSVGALKRIRHRIIHRSRERVFLIRTFQRHNQNAIGKLGVDLFAHGYCHCWKDVVRPPHVLFP